MTRQTLRIWKQINYANKMFILLYILKFILFFYEKPNETKI